VRHVLENSLLRFWFRFVFPNLSFPQQMGPRRAFSARIRPELDTYFSLCFERLCRQVLPVIYERDSTVGSVIERVKREMEKNKNISKRVEYLKDILEKS